MADRHVWIAIPAYTGTIHLGTMRSLFNDVLALADRGDKVTIFDESGNAMIADCRALIVAKFLESEGTDLVFIDSDVAWEAGAILKLIDAPVDFVAGIYPQRKDPINYCVQYIPDRAELWADPDTGLLEVAGVPAGFMRLTRAMLERMVAHYPETAFYCPEGPEDTVYGLFESWRIGNIKFGEDYSFCARWREMGGQIWVNPEIRMGHIGNKTFTGSLGDWLRDRPHNLKPLKPKEAPMGAMMHEDRFGVVTLTIDPASVDTITTAEQDFTLLGLKVGDFVAVNKPSCTTGLGVANARVKAADTLSITFVNPTAGGVNAGSETWTIFWFRPESTPAGRVNV